MELLGKIIDRLGQSINLRITRHNLLSSNIANSDIPKYKGFDLMVEESLRASEAGVEGALKKTHPHHMDPIEMNQIKIKDAPYIRLPDSEFPELDLNRMMVDLAENAVKYQATVELLNKKFGSLKYAIEGK